MTRTADVIALTLTGGSSLAGWRSAGIADRELALYRRLLALGHRVVLGTYGDPHEEAQLADAHSPGADIVTIERADDNEATHRALGELLAQRVVDVRPRPARTIIKTNQTWGGVAADAAARSLRRSAIDARTVARSGHHWSDSVRRERPNDHGWIRRVDEYERGVYDSADLVVCTSERSMLAVTAQHGVPPDRCRVIPNYVEIPPTDSNVAERSESEVLCAGRLVAQKRVDLLIDAIRHVGPRARLTVVGSGPLDQELRKCAGELGVDASFEPRLGHRELLGRMRRCAVFAQVSSFEGHPKTVIEAMAAGCAVVCVDAPGLSDVIVRGRTGLVTPADAARIGCAITTFLENPELRLSIGSAARAEAQRSYSLDRVLGLELACYHDAFDMERRDRRADDQRVVA